MYARCLLPLLLLALAACQRDADPVAGSPGPSAAPAAAQDAATAAGHDQPRDDVPPATAPPGTLPPRLQQGGQSLADWDGYGEVRLGMSADDVRRHWGGALKGGADPAAGPEACFYLLPQWAADRREFGFMIEQGRLVRYESGNAKELAPGGGRIGMPADEITRLYAGQVERQPHKYVEGAQVLRVTPPDRQSVLIFETDAAGRVITWRVGLPPAIDLVEGCG